MIADFIATLLPTNSRDAETWRQLQSTLVHYQQTDVFWYPGSGFDFSPLSAKADGRLRNALLSDCAVFYSDAHPACRTALESAYVLFVRGERTLSGFRPALTYLRGAEGIVEAFVPLESASSADIDLTFLRLRVGAERFQVFYFFAPPGRVLHEVIREYGVGIMTVAPLGSWRGGVGDVPLQDLAMLCLSKLPEPLQPEFVLTNQTFDSHSQFMKYFKYCSLIPHLSAAYAQLYRRRRPRAVMAGV